MNLFKRSIPPDRVPVLTEVVNITIEPTPAPPVPQARTDTVDTADHPPAAPAALATEEVPDAGGAAPGVEQPANNPPAGDQSGNHQPSSAALSESDQDELTRQVMADIQRQVDALLEYRMKEVLGPVLTRLTDALVRDARAELGLVLKDVVTRAVAQEVAKHRPK